MIRDGIRVVAAAWVWIAWVALPTQPVHADPSVTFDRWYAVMLEGQHVGWSRLTARRSDQPPHAPPTIITSTQMRVTVKRGPVAMPIWVKSTFTETADGQPMTARTTQKLGKIQLTQILRFTPDGLTVTTRQGKLKQTRKLPYPRVSTRQSPSDSRSGWLTPAQTQQHVQQQLAAGKSTIRCWTLDPALGVEPVRITMKVLGQKDTTAMGKVVPTFVCDTTVSKLPGMVTREHLDPQGWSVKSTVATIPGMTLTLLQADQQLATAPIDPPQLLASMIVRPNRPINNPRQLTHAVYDLRFAPPSSRHKQPPPTIPACGYQRIQRKNKRTTRVVVDLNQPVANPNDHTPRWSHLNASAALNTHDPKIRQLTQQALADLDTHATPADKAEALRRFVHRYIRTKDLAVGFATASEVARTRQGDCTEHAVLLAAMLRCAQIPSRTVSGLIYVDRFLDQANVFGYHMWTQAWLGTEQAKKGRWIDLDATLSQQPFDAAHIALATSALNDPTMTNDLVTLLPTLGRLKIKVVDTTTRVMPTTSGR